MRKLIVMLPLLLLIGCGVESYRDTIATSYGFLAWAQSTYKVPCQATPNAATCALITRGIGLHNAATDALNAYCNGPAAPGNAQWTQGGPCSPIKSLQPALVTAIANLNPVIADVKLLATGKSQPKLTAEELLQKPETRDMLLAARLEMQP
jgi:hypothetical protein